MNSVHGAMLGLALTALPVMAGFEVKEQHRRIEITDHGRTVFGWQAGPLEHPKGGEVFAASAFIHPLCTPSGFGLTTIQPDDHLHHFGVWWPWKKVTVGGKDYVTWEMQQHEGRHDAVEARVLGATADEVLIQARNETRIMVGGTLKPVIEELVRLKLFRIGADAYGVDVHINQAPVFGQDVAITHYRYSGFSWRGTGAWHKGNSVMRSSGGHDRDTANHQPAKWVTVDGETPTGRATMLLMSGAAESELLRVWDSKQFDGTPFVNFNPVVKASVALEPAHTVVSDRRYRLVVADRAIPPAEADQLWAEWVAGK